MPKVTLYCFLLFSILLAFCSKGDDTTQPPRDFNAIPQGDAPCTPAKNSMTLEGNGHPPRVFKSVYKTPPQFAGANFKFEALEVGFKQIELVLHFNPKYTSNRPPPDGVYTTGTVDADNYPRFKSLDSDIVFISFITYDPTFYGYQSFPGQKVYIKTVDGKMTATACNAEVLSKKQQNSYSGLFTFSITEQ